MDEELRRRVGRDVGPGGIGPGGCARDVAGVWRGAAALVEGLGFGGFGSSGLSRAWVRCWVRFYCGSFVFCDLLGSFGKFTKKRSLTVCEIFEKTQIAYASTC